jgi:hypothetical protein
VVVNPDITTKEEILNLEKFQDCLRGLVSMLLENFIQPLQQNKNYNSSTQ